MNLQLVETIKQHKYGGKVRTVGEQYEAQAAHLPVLIKARWVKIVKPKPAPTTPVTPGPVTPAEKPARNYKRRDLAAEK
ncbi:MAG TPA: hypothetical protein VMV94_06985 [Phycisphaerae bacterium]|nr:hypothetical protein [Phycisphaerae bacterium]